MLVGSKASNVPGFRHDAPSTNQIHILIIVDEI